MKILTVCLLVCAMAALTRATWSGYYWGGYHCGFGWTRYGRHCFFYTSTPMTWANAEKYCQRWNANLASVRNYYELRVIQNMMSRYTHKYTLAWLGGYDATQERTWLWSDGKPFKYNYWAVGQPNNCANAHCLVMNYGAHRKFDDQPCRFKRPFVCAKWL